MSKQYKKPYDDKPDYSGVTSQEIANIIHQCWLVINHLEGKTVKLTANEIERLEYSKKHVEYCRAELKKRQPKQQVLL